MGVVKVNDVAPALSAKLFVALSCRTRPVPAKPEIVPPTVKETGVVLWEFCAGPPHAERQSAAAIKTANFTAGNFMALSGVDLPAVAVSVAAKLIPNSE
jgi:hypothetical protein